MITDDGETAQKNTTAGLEVSCNPRPKSTKVKIRRRTVGSQQIDPVSHDLASESCETTDDVSVDVLITIMQDPDTGLPRPSASNLSNVKLRTGTCNNNYQLFVVSTCTGPLA